MSSTVVVKASPASQKHSRPLGDSSHAEAPAAKRRLPTSACVGNTSGRSNESSHSLFNLQKPASRVAPVEINQDLVEPGQEAHSPYPAWRLEGLAPASPILPLAPLEFSTTPLRGLEFTGVYRSRQEPGKWRTQFCFNNKVMALGSWDTAEEAARCWNVAARLFRGPDAWLNSVEPQLPAGHTAGDLFVSSDKAAASVTAIAEAAGLAAKVSVVSAL